MEAFWHIARYQVHQNQGPWGSGGDTEGKQFLHVFQRGKSLKILFSRKVHMGLLFGKSLFAVCIK
jgi:hypothetical protein